MESDDLRPLVEQSSAGSAEAFKALYEHLGDRVHAYVRYRTSTPDAALDCTQDVFVALYAALPKFTFQTREQFYAYVFTITKRTLAKHYADKHTKATVFSSDVDADEVAAAGENTELQDMVARALATLDEKTREIIILHHWSRYTFGEIATLLRMSESAVRVRHHRGQKQLATMVTTVTV